MAYSQLSCYVEGHEVPEAWIFGGRCELEDVVKVATVGEGIVLLSYLLELPANNTNLSPSEPYEQQVPSHSYLS